MNFCGAQEFGVALILLLVLSHHGATPDVKSLLYVVMGVQEATVNNTLPLAAGRVISLIH